MTLEEAPQAAETPITVPEDSIVTGGCAHADPEGLPDGLSFMLLRGRVARVEVWEGPYKTLSGIGIGTPEETVIETYPGQIETREQPYDEAGHYWFTSPRNRPIVGLS
jgi:hypothetical protein